MSTYTRPLVALSLTEPDVGLLRYASLVAKLAPCEEIRFAHVVSSETEKPSPDDVRALRDRLQSEVDAHFKPAKLPTVFDIVHGPRVDQLLALAVEHKNDVILLGHRQGRRGRRALARQLAMVAPCSVWMVPQQSPDRLDCILVPVDFSDHSADAMSVATAIAAACGLERCLAVHVYFDKSMIRYDEHISEIIGKEQDTFQKFVSEIDTHGVEVEPIFEESTHHAEAILRVAERREANLIVMSTHGRTRAAAVLLGSVTAQTLSQTTVPLLAIKHFGHRMTVLQALLNHRFWESPTPKTN